MTRSEEQAALIKQISNLYSRIECGRDEGCQNWEEELELKRLEKKLDEMKGGGIYRHKPIHQF